MGTRKSGLSISAYFSICFGLTFVIASILVIAVVNREMRNEALSGARERARIILKRNLATHEYFSQELKPKLFERIVGTESKDYFEPSWMSSTYAIRQIDKYFTSQDEYGDYYFKECAVNARSPENEADDYERAFIEELSQKPELQVRSGIRKIEGQLYFVSLHRGEAMEQSCLRCHSTPENAPGDLVAQYGGQRSFNRSVGDVVSAMSIRVPLAKAYAATRAITIKLSIVLMAVLGLMFYAQYIFTKRVILQPLRTLQAKSSEIAFDPEHLGEEMPVPYGRELGEVVSAFNKMSVRLRDNRDVLESELVEGARLNKVLLDNSPCVAMVLEKGTRKIIASNEVARELGAIPGEFCYEKCSQRDDPCPWCLAEEFWAYNETKDIEIEYRGSYYRGVWVSLNDELYVHYIFDITDRKNADEALRQSEERFRRAVVESPFPIMIHAEDGEVLQINKAWTELTGYESEEIPTLSEWTERGYGERKDIVRSRIDKIFDCDTSVKEGEYTIKSKEGKTLTWDFSSASLGKLPDGRRLVISMAVDITEHKRVEKHTIDLARFPSENPNPVLRVAKNGVLLYANDACNTLLAEWNCQEDEIMPENWRETVSEVFAAGLSKMVEIEHADRTLAFMIVPILDAGYANLYARDITELKRVEKHTIDLAKFPSENPNPILRVAKNGVLLYANDASNSLLAEWNCQEDEIMPASWRETVSEVFATGSSKRLEIEHAGRTFAFMIVPILDADYANLYARDITELKKAENQLKDAHDKLEARVRKRTHELAETVEMLQIEADGHVKSKQALQTSKDKYRELNTELENHAAHLRQLNHQLIHAEESERRRLARILHDHLQQMLVAAKLNINILEPKLKEPSFRRSLSEVSLLLDNCIDESRSLTVELFPPVLREGSFISAIKWLTMRFENQYKLTVSIDVEGDFDHIEQDCRVFIFATVRELLFNIVKHANCDTAAIRITCPSDRQIELTVEDDGVGFETERHQTGKNLDGGFGLFSIRERTAAIGGMLDIRSSPGQGTRVTLLTPLSSFRSVHAGSVKTQMQPSLASQESSVTDEPVGSQSGKGRIRVLLAEDHAMVRESLATLLQRENDIEVIAEAPNGKIAVEMTLLKRPEIVIMDIDMPVMDGVEATRRIKNEYPYIKVIALSVHEQDERVEAILQAGAESHLSKKDATEQLVTAIRSGRS